MNVPSRLVKYLQFLRCASSSVTKTVVCVCPSESEAVGAFTPQILSKQYWCDDYVYVSVELPTLAGADLPLHEA
uniref:Uncharacterized protein n=1 Tax=Physcomitrium patens TaxID=3218 RepID=A0A2K1IAA9_PHYPA|nr:hypothetical protein PHYPA_030782 [Physcomitrium patens]